MGEDATQFDAPLRRLRDDAREAWAGSPRTVLVTGPSHADLADLTGRWVEESDAAHVRRFPAAALAYCPEVLERVSTVSRSRPAVLVVENLHEAGLADLSLLLDLLGELEDHRLLAVLTSCPPDPMAYGRSWALPTFIDQLVGRPGVTHVRLGDDRTGVL